jgi:hypothetical protein
LAPDIFEHLVMTSLGVWTGLKEQLQALNVLVDQLNDG